MEYSAVLETAVAAAFGKTVYSEESTGVRISLGLFESNKSMYTSVPWTFFFQRRNPGWLKRFNRYLAVAEQAGFRDEWINRNK